jgi:hypothetical protein
MAGKVGFAIRTCKHCSQEIRWIYTNKRWVGTDTTRTREENSKCTGPDVNGHQPSPKQ